MGITVKSHNNRYGEKRSAIRRKHKQTRPQGSTRDKGVKTMTQAHTAGPWRPEQVGGVGGGCRIMAGTEAIAAVHNLGRDRCSEHQANAEAIAAVPDLIEACRYAFENLRPAGNVRKDFSGHNAMATLSRALEKAGVNV